MKSASDTIAGLHLSHPLTAQQIAWLAAQQLKIEAMKGKDK